MKQPLNVKVAGRYQWVRRDGPVKHKPMTRIVPPDHAGPVQPFGYGYIGNYLEIKLPSPLPGFDDYEKELVRKALLKGWRVFADPNFLITVHPKDIAP